MVQQVRVHQCKSGPRIELDSCRARAGSLNCLNPDWKWFYILWRLAVDEANDKRVQGLQADCNWNYAHLAFQRLATP